jgi:hypothetical protein
MPRLQNWPATHIESAVQAPDGLVPPHLPFVQLALLHSSAAEQASPSDFFGEHVAEEVPAPAQ